MSEVGTGYIIEIGLETCKENINLSNVDFVLDFYTNAYRRESISKSQLVRVQKESGDVYYAMLDSSSLGSGYLYCRATIFDIVPKWQGGVRPVVLTQYAGKYIGNQSSNCGCCYETPCAITEEFDEGYRLTFNYVFGLPKADVAYIFYGKIINQIHSFNEITADMLVSPDNSIVSVNADTLPKTSVSINAGDKLLVLVPSDSGRVAKKDDGIGGKMAFDTSIMGSNGDVKVEIDGVEYLIFGEFMTLSGEMFIYVD